MHEMRLPEAITARDAPNHFPARGLLRGLPDVFLLLQNLPALSHKANARENNQLSTLSEWVCEIAEILYRGIVIIRVSWHNAGRNGN